MYHKIILVGNLGKDPEMRYTPAGQAVTNFSMATSEKWTAQDGELHDRTIWWRVATWGKLAENVNTYLKKGSKMLVEGRMTADSNGNPRIWTGQDGASHASYEVTAQTVKFLNSRTDGGTSGSSDEATAPVEAEAEIPF